MQEIDILVKMHYQEYFPPEKSKKAKIPFVKYVQFKKKKNSSLFKQIRDSSEKKKNFGRFFALKVLPKNLQSRNPEFLQSMYGHTLQKSNAFHQSFLTVSF